MKSTSPFYPHCLMTFKQSTFFSSLDEEQLANMLQGFRRETWKKNTTSDFHLHERFYVVTKGRVELIRTDYSTGRDLTVFLLHPGDAFDVITLLDGNAHDITPMALDQVDVLSVPIASVREWIEAHPAFNQQFLPYLGRQMRALEDLATNLAFHDTITRLGKLITHHLLPDHLPTFHGMPPIRLINDVSHEALARMIGSVRVVVSRHIQQWKEEGVVSAGRKNLVIRDLESVLHRSRKIQETSPNQKNSRK